VTVAWVYLVVSALGALLTFLALFPGPRSGLLPALFFVSSLLVGELAPFHVAWQAFATVVFIAFGALDAWPGWLGLALTLASWCGLLIAIRRARRTVDIMEAALVATLGADYRAAISPELTATIGAGEKVRAWRRPYRSRDKDVERIRNIPYGPAGKRNLLDVYRPRSQATGCPVLVYVHGGGWVTGSKDRQGLPLMLLLAARGWVCVAPNYRLSPKATFPDHLVDVKRAVAWVREHGAEHGADPRFLVVSGGSAGGHLAALVALTPNDPEYQPGFEHADTAVTAAVPLYGVYDLLDRRGIRRDRVQRNFLEKRVLKSSPERDREAWEKASPISHVRSDAPPFFVVHGRNDSLLFWEDAHYFVDALRAVSGEPVVYAELPGAQHAFELFASVRGVAVVEGVARFLAWVRSTRPPASRRVPGIDSPSRRHA
jgi:acetyl esterase/lipase